MRRQNGDFVVCESPKGNAVAVPAWMTDKAFCAGFSVGPPVVSLSALRELRNVLHSLRLMVEWDNSSGKASPLELSDEAKDHDVRDSDRAVPRDRIEQRSGASPVGRRPKSRTQKGNRRAAPKRSARRRRRPNRTSA